MSLPFFPVAYLKIVYMLLRNFSFTVYLIFTNKIGMFQLPLFAFLVLSLFC